MSDILNFMNENSTFQSLLAGQTEREEDYRNQVEQLDTQKIMSGIESIPIAGEFFSKVKDLYGKVSDFADNVQSNINSLTSGSGETIMNPASVLDGVGNKISSRMNTNAFERDPEDDFVGEGEGQTSGVIDSLQSMFRGGIPVPQSVSNVVSNVQNRVSGAASELQTTVENGASNAVEAGTGAVEAGAGGVEGAVEAGTGLLDVAGAALGPLALAAGLGYSLYDAFKKAPPPPMDFTFATPNFTAGI
jgi:hypothetical protein